MEIFDSCPTSPAWLVDWRRLDEQQPLVAHLKGCPQNPRYHAEGDVWQHTRLVCEAMARSAAWRELDENTRQDLFAAALLHDAAKPECTRVHEDGRLTSRGHARRGAVLARRELWRAGVPAERRERICRLIRHHMAPLYLRDSDHQERQVLTLSHTLRCDHLALLGRADAEGRQCEDTEDLWLRHETFERSCRGLHSFDRPFPFPSRHTRFRYFRHLTSDPTEKAPDPGFEVVLLSGLPGSGKRAWLEENAGTLPVLDMDAQRRQLDVELRANQGPVISAGREQARRYLTAATSFVWRDMNLSRQLRDHLITLFASFEARVRIVHLERSEQEVQDHMASLGLDGDLDYLLERWEVPDATEAHDVELLTR